MLLAGNGSGVKTYPPVPHVDDAPGLFDSGHLWIQELLDGGHLRFQLRESGEIRFGGRDRLFKPDAVPLAYQHAVRHVRETLDRHALRAAVDDVESVVFFGEAMHEQSISYDFGRTPSVLGFDIYDTDRGFLPPDTAERVFERLGIQSVNTFQREVRAVDFSPDTAAIPQSAWYDGPAAGIFVRNKTGGRAKLPNPAIEPADPEPFEATAEELADRYVTESRLRAIKTRLETDGAAADFQTLFDRVHEEVLREIHARLSHGGTTIDVSDFRAAVAARVREWMAE